MSTRQKLSVPAPINVPAPKTSALDDAFYEMMSLVSTAPVRSSVQTGDGAIIRDGLDVATLRRLALRWCARMREGRRFKHSDLQGLEMVLAHYTDEEFTEMVHLALLTRAR